MSKREKIGGVGKNPTIDGIAGLKAESGTAGVKVDIAKRVKEPEGNFYSRLQNPQAAFSTQTGRRNRLPEIAAIAKPLMEERFAASRKLIEEDYKNNGAAYQAAFCEAVGEVLESAPQDDITYSNLVILPTNSSRLLKTHDLDIGLHTDQLYLEEEPAGGTWDAGWLLNHFDDDMEWIEMKLNEEIPRLQGYEIDVVADEHIWNYHAAARDFVSETVPSVLEMGSFKTLPKGQSFTVLFGEGMEAAEVLYQEASE